MFKDKDTRDTVLLVFMAVMTLIFLVYLFIPSSGDKGAEKPSAQEGHIPAREDRIIERDNGREKTVYDECNRQLELLLEDSFYSIRWWRAPAMEFELGPLKRFVTGLASGANEKWRHQDLQKLIADLNSLDFRELGKVPELPFPDSWSKEFRFNLYMAAFLIQAEKAKLLNGSTLYSNSRFEDLLELGPYRILDNTIERDIHSLPVLLYFCLFIGDGDLFPAADRAVLFREKLDEITDRSKRKWVLKVKENLQFSREFGSIRVEWREGDFPDADDRGQYPGIRIPRIRFLRQRYLVLPDSDKSKNKWLSELQAADSGDIELVDLRFIDENPSRNLKGERIFYSPTKPHFIVLLEGYKSSEPPDPVDMMVIALLDYFSRGFDSLIFPTPDQDQKIWKDELARFGNFLKDLNF